METCTGNNLYLMPTANRSHQGTRGSVGGVVTRPVQTEFPDGADQAQDAQVNANF